MDYRSLGQNGSYKFALRNLQIHIWICFQEHLPMMDLQIVRGVAPQNGASYAQKLKKAATKNKNIVATLMA